MRVSLEESEVQCCFGAVHAPGRSATRAEFDVNIQRGDAHIVHQMPQQFCEKKSQITINSPASLRPRARYSLPTQRHHIRWLDVKSQKRVYGLDLDKLSPISCYHLSECPCFAVNNLHDHQPSPFPRSASSPPSVTRSCSDLVIA